MLLFLRSKDLILEARERLTNLGVSFQMVSGEPVFEIRSQLSIFPPQVLASKLADLGRVEAAKSKTPLLDMIPSGHEVKVEVKGRKEPIIFRNQPRQAVWIAGPCSLDESNSIRENAQRLSGLGIQVLRGGAVKPRTSPHEFQGVGRSGYALLADAAHEFGMACISEALSEDDVVEAVEFLDIIQVGARNMQNFALLRKLGRCSKPVMLKRGPGATLLEWASAAEYILAEGNRCVILCERGVRGLEQELRYTLDLAGAAFMQHRYPLPMVIDPSHATGIKQILDACTAGALAMGFAGVMLETHPRPVEARSDALQALTSEDFASLAGRYLQN
ncbi:MAG TPA: 3-deoxy-7-phosphoheptulonate synthase [Bdellovibrionota bacterium]|jgi:3-deoxy-7-phosphoheptulonate synthase